MPLGQPRTPKGKFDTIPTPAMPLEQALRLMGSPPDSWTPYFHIEAARALHHAGLALLAQKRVNGTMVRVWKAALRA